MMEALHNFAPAAAAAALGKLARTQAAGMLVTATEEMVFLQTLTELLLFTLAGVAAAAKLQTALAPEVWVVEEHLDQVVAQIRDSLTAVAVAVLEIFV
jgi:hypothetical protein